MIKPKAINDEFYFYNGHIIRLSDDYYNLYKLCFGSSHSGENKDEILKHSINKIDELNQEYDQEIKQEIEIQKFTKQLKPYFEAIAKEIYKSNK